MIRPVDVSLKIEHLSHCVCCTICSDDSIDSAYCFPVLEKNEQNSLEIVLVSVTYLSFIMKVSDMELLSWTRPIIEFKTLHVLRMSLGYFSIRFL